MAEKIDARVLLSGDRYQHGWVERGAALRLLEEEAGLVPADVKEIKRQSGEYKEAVRALAEGEVSLGLTGSTISAGCKRFHRRPLQTDGGRLCGGGAEGKTALVVSPTHFEAGRITAEIRRTLKEQGDSVAMNTVFAFFRMLILPKRSEETRSVTRRRCAAFHQNAKGFTRGERVNVAADSELPLDQASRFQVFHVSTLSLAPGDSCGSPTTATRPTASTIWKWPAISHVSEFDQDGNIVLDNGWTIGKDLGFLDSWLRDQLACHHRPYGRPSPRRSGE